MHVVGDNDPWVMVSAESGILYKVCVEFKQALLCKVHTKIVAIPNVYVSLVFAVAYEIHFIVAKTDDKGCVVYRSNRDSQGLLAAMCALRRVDAWLSGSLFVSHPKNSVPPCLPSHVAYNS